MNRRLRLCLVGLVLPLALAPAASAPAQELSCQNPQKPMIAVDLLFGRNIGKKLGVTERLWSQFLAREVTPRFPNGFSVTDSYGQWRDAKDKTVVRERSKIVTVIADDSAELRRSIDEIAAAYKKRFRQDAVGIVIKRACVSF